MSNYSIFLVLCLALLCIVQANKPIVAVTEKELVLVGVNVLSHHGARTPIHSISSLDRKWDGCEDHRISTSTTKANGKVVYQNEKEGNCRLGQLTSKGIKQMTNFGMYLKKQYGSTIAIDKSNFRLEATDHLRSIESALAIATGAYAEEDNPESTSQFDHEVFVNAASDLFPNNEACSKLESIIQNVRNQESYIKFMEKYMDMENELIEKLNMSVYAYSGHQSISDILFCMKQNDISLPTNVSDALYEKLQEVMVLGWVKHSQDPEYRKYGMGRLILRWLNRWDQLDLENSLGLPQIQVGVGDETSIIALYDAFGFNEKSIAELPPFGSSIIVEVYQHPKSKKKYLKFFFNKILRIVQGCNALCPLEKVQESCKKDTLTEEEFLTYCPTVKEESFDFKADGYDPFADEGFK